MSYKTPININQLQIGQNVRAEFTPYSQKYLDEYVPKSGIIKSISVENYKDFYTNDIKQHYNIMITNKEGKEESLLYWGDDYYYSLFLIEK
jgi:hypothetical protein